MRNLHLAMHALNFKCSWDTLSSTKIYVPYGVLLQHSDNFLTHFSKGEETFF